MRPTGSSLLGRVVEAVVVSIALAGAVGPAVAAGLTRADWTHGGRWTRGALPRLAITTERLTYRLAQADSLYVGQLVVRMVNQTPDTVFLATRCALGSTPNHEFEPLDGSELFLLDQWGCALTGESAPADRRGVAIAPDQARRDTIRFGARPFVRRGESRAREGISRFRLRYMPVLHRGFRHKTWTTDPHMYLVSDPFELLTPRAEP